MIYLYNAFLDKFPVLCTIEADLSQLCDESTIVYPSSNDMFPLPFNKEPYWKVKFDIEIKLGTTELEACVKWSVGVSNFRCYLLKKKFSEKCLNHTVE